MLMTSLPCPSTVALLGIIVYLDYVLSLELTELRVPTHVPLGFRAVLQCRWELGPSDVLYSVKWYKDGKEFFRHVPGDEEPLRKFPLPGVDIEEFNLSGSNLTLAPAVLATSGRYRCEVSGERPLFQTVSKHADMIVAVFPSHGPSINGLKSRYHVGDHVNVNCTSNQSKPTTGFVKLSWFINGKPASTPLMSRPEYIEHDEATISSWIEFTITKDFMGTLKVECIATIASVYWRSIEKNATVSEGFENIEGTHLLKYSTASIKSYSTNSKSGLKIMKTTILIFIFLLPRVL